MLRRRQGLARKRYEVPQIIQKLREAEVLLSKGQAMGQMVRSLGMTEQMDYCWRREYGGMDQGQAQRLREVECENTRLRKIVSDLALDNAILKEMLSTE